MQSKSSSRPKKASSKPVTATRVRNLLKHKLQAYKRTAMGGWRKVYKKAAAELYRETGS